jgi:hypothetical protein
MKTYTGFDRMRIFGHDEFNVRGLFLFGMELFDGFEVN